MYANSTHAHVSNKSRDAGGVIEIALLFTVLAACVAPNLTSNQVSLMKKRTDDIGH